MLDVGNSSATVRIRDANVIGWRYRELELVYLGDPAAGWEGGAPTLFPAVGRSFVASQLEKGGSDDAGGDPGPCTWLDGADVRPMPVHGFAMTERWTLASAWAGRDCACAELLLSSSSASDEARAAFPRSFALRLSVVLSSDLLRFEYRVAHEPGPATRKEGAGSEVGAAKEQVLPFSLGNHLTLRFPLRPGGRCVGWGGGARERRERPRRWHPSVARSFVRRTLGGKTVWCVARSQRSTSCLASRCAPGR